MTKFQRSAMQAALQWFEHLESPPHLRGSEDCHEDMIEELRAALAEEPRLCAVPEGWKLVPTQPTAEMLAATSWPGCATTDYAHMIAAAPSPPSREWQGLTDEAIADIVDDMNGNEPTAPFWRDLARAIERALKEKNHE